MPAHPVLRTLHDLGLASWAGGSLMGAIGLNGAASTLTDPQERAKASTKGWSRWAPVNAAGVAAHLVGAGGLLIADLPRVREQRGVASASLLKTGSTAAALGVAGWSALLNRKMAASLPVRVAGATEPGPLTPDDVARTQRQLRVVQWLNPLVSFALIGVSDYLAEQTRTTEQVKGRLARLTGAAPVPVLAGGAVAALGLTALALGRRDKETEQDVVVELVEVDVLAVPVDGYADDLGSTRPGLDSTRTGLDSTRTGLDSTRTGLDSTGTGLDGTRPDLGVAPGPLS